MKRLYTCDLCGFSSMESTMIDIKFDTDTKTICNDCISDANTVLNKKNIEEELDLEKLLQEEIDNEENKIRNFNSPIEIKDMLDEYVIGQDETKKILSVAVYSHIKRMQNPEKLNRKNNILLIGPTGSGKTLLANILSKELELPMVSIDATSLTESGYSGADIDNIIKSLVNKAGSFEKAKFGIVFIDEIDKIGKRQIGGNKKDIGGEGVQQGLLKIIEGTEMEIQEPSSNMSAFNNNKELFDTSNILFIGGGAFVGLNEIEETRKRGTSTLGFHESKETKKTDIKNFINIDNKDLENFGLIPEFLGRFPVKSKLNELTRDEMIKIISEPKNSVLSYYKEYFKLDNIILEFTKEALMKIVDISIETKLGARGLQQIMEHLLLELSFNVLKYKNKHIFIDENFVVTKDLNNIIIKDFEIQIKE